MASLMYLSCCLLVIYLSGWCAELVASSNDKLSHEDSEFTVLRYERTLYDFIDELRENCTDIHHPPDNYNSSCEYIQAECENKYELFNYLDLVMCKLSKAKVSLIILYTPSNGSKCEWVQLLFRISHLVISFLDYG